MSESEYRHKQVIAVRKDLNMRKGKMIAQGGHAVQLAICPRPTDEDIARGFMVVPLNEHNTAWFRENFKKVGCGAKDEAELIALYNHASELGIPCSMVTDHGITEFNGVHTITAVAVGPAHESLVDLVTGHLPLL